MLHLPVVVQWGHPIIFVMRFTVQNGFNETKVKWAWRGPLFPLAGGYDARDVKG